MGTGGTYPAEMQSWPETDHSSPFNAEVKKEHSYTFISPYTSMLCKSNLNYHHPTKPLLTVKVINILTTAVFH
jgi:hypothetical protein